MQSNSGKYLVWGGVLLIIGATVGFIVFQNTKPSQLDGFAKCLGEKGAKFYGAFWCPHCQKQKALFGKSVKFLPYVECSTPDSQGVTQVCKDAKIEGYPTWEFSDKSRLSGEQTLDKLAEKTVCELPKK